MPATAKGSRKNGKLGAEAVEKKLNEMLGPARRSTDDPVRPAHYQGDYVMRITEDFGLDKDACLFQVVKYVLRAGKKPGDPMLQDLRKASWYLERKIINLIAAGHGEIK